MITSENFVRQSLDLNLFFLRIMKEHSFFLEAAFITPRDSNFIQQADAFRNEFTRLLAEAVSLANGVISPFVLSSGEIVTNYTLNAENLTEFYTGVPFDTNVTRAELALGSGTGPINYPLLTERVANLNQRAITTTSSLIQFKSIVLENVLSCRMFTLNYPLLIDHIRREAILFVNMLTRIQNQESVDLIREIVEQEQFWNRIMAEHAKFIRGLLDPTEEQLFITADNFGKEFDQLTAEALAAQTQTGLLPLVTSESLNATERIKNFKSQGTEGLLTCKIRSIIIPLLGDHVLREANHYLRLLRMYSATV